MVQGLRYLLLLLVLASCTFAQSLRVEGVVYDKSNKQALSYATVQLKATTIGTTTNSQGQFTLDLPQGEHVLLVSYIGYKSAEIKVKLPGAGRLELALEPLSIILPEIVIGSNDEDPAYGIIRKAIKHKNENRKNLNSLEYDEYRKNIFKSAGQIASIEESFLKGFKTGDNEKEFVLASFKTENIKKDNKSVNAFKNQKMDFYKDTVNILGNKIHLPLAVDAFDYYKYKLLNTRSTESKHVYFIEVIPRSEIRPLFKGMVLIEDSTFALVGLDFNSNKGVMFPFITDLNIRFSERKLKVDEIWFPQYQEARISLGVNMGGLLSVEKMELEQFRSYSNQKINRSGNIDSAVIVEQNPFRNLTFMDTTAADTSGKNSYKPVMLTRAVTDSLRPIPLNNMEVNAYRDLDSTKKPMDMIKTGGALSGFVEIQRSRNSSGSSIWAKAAEQVFNYLNFKNNRVGGIGIGANYSGTIDTAFTYSAAGLYSFGTKKPEGKGSIGYTTRGKNPTNVNIGVFSQVKRWNENTQFTELMNSISVTLGLEDNFNYLMSKGYSVSMQKNWNDSLKITFGFISEKQSSLTDIVNHRIVNSGFAKRSNPAIKEGMDNRFTLAFISGSDPFSFQFMPQSGFTVLGDLSLKELGGDFGYLKLYSACQFRFNTIFRELFFPPFMLIRLEGGIVNGNYGLQHILTPENSLAFLSSFGVFKGLKPYEYTGDKMAALHIEHNWRGIVFQSIGLRSLSEMNIGLTTGGSILKMWNNSDVVKPNDNIPVYWEIYSGVTGILGIIRLDVAYTSNKIFVARAGFTLAL